MNTLLCFFFFFNLNTTLRKLKIWDCVIRVQATTTTKACKLVKEICF